MVFKLSTSSQVSYPDLTGYIPLSLPAFLLTKCSLRQWANVETDVFVDIWNTFDIPISIFSFPTKLSSFRAFSSSLTVVCTAPWPKKGPRHVAWCSFNIVPLQLLQIIPLPSVLHVSGIFQEGSPILRYCLPVFEIYFNTYSSCNIILV